jgi:hypothetical protein
VLLAPAEDAFGHFAAGLGDLVADVAGRARIDRTPAPLAGLGDAVILRNTPSARTKPTTPAITLRRCAG